MRKTVPGHAFVGFRNFTRVLADPVARWSLWVTVLLAVINVTVEFLLGLALALAMVRNFRGRGIIMSLLIIPLFISPVIVGQAWALLLQRPFGPTNYILSQILGHEVTIGWLTQAPWNFIAIILADVWQWTPFMFVILLAGLTAIPPNLYEAAELDGVDGWRAFWWITLPLLAPVIFFNLVLQTIDAFKAFTSAFIISGGTGGPIDSTLFYTLYLYEEGFGNFRMGYASAMAWVLLIAIAAFTAAAFLTSKYWVFYEDDGKR